MDLIENLIGRTKIFGTPVQFITRDKMYQEFEPQNADGSPANLVQAASRFESFLKNEFADLDFFMPPAIILQENYRRLSGQSPVCTPLLSADQLRSDGDQKPIGAVISPGGEHGSSVQFLAAFTKAPSAMYNGFAANNNQWKLLQICHEIAHLSGPDELKADVTGMVTYYALTKDTEFLNEWMKSRTLKSLFSGADGNMDIKAAYAACKVQQELQKGGYEHLNLDDQNIPEFTEQMIGNLDLDEKSCAKVKDQILENLGDTKTAAVDDLAKASKKVFEDESLSDTEQEIAGLYVINTILMQNSQQQNATHTR